MMIPVTICNGLVIPSFEFQNYWSDWCANPFQDDAAHAISVATTSQRSMHPIRQFTGGPARQSWLRSLPHADRMQKSHATRSRSRHREFVTRVIIFAQLVSLTVRFASFSSQRYSNCFPGSIRSVYTQQHTRWTRSPLCIHQILTGTPPNWLPPFAFDCRFSRPSRFTSPLSNAWTAPPDARTLVLPR